MVASVLKRGNVAIVSYATDPIGADGDDILRFVILTPIGSGTQIFFSDRNWNGTGFPAASAGEGTFTYTAGADLPAGTVITITSAQLLAAGMDLSNGGDTIYVYQGTDANTPTTFLFAIDVGDGNSVFEAGELTGTGLTAGVDAVAVGHDQASYSGPSTQIPQTQLTAISNTNQWHGHSGDDIGGTIYDDRADTSLSGPLNNPDMQLFVVNNGGGQSDAIVRIDNDEAANIGTNLTRLFRDNPMFTRLEDITFDIEDGVWFAADNEGTDVTRILKGNIADLFNGNPNPTITVVFDYVNNGADPNDDKFIQGIEIDTVANRIFFGLGEISFGHELRSVDYNGGNSRNWGLIDLVIDPTFGFAGGIEDFVVDTANNTAYFSYVLVNAGAGQVLQNYVVRLTAPLNAAAPNPLVENYAIVNITNAGAPPPGYAAGRLPDAEGSIRGMDYHAATNTLWFVTGRLGAAGTAGIFTLNLTTGVYTEIWQQPSNNAHNTPQSFPTTLLVDIEVDSIGGRYYVTSLNSTDTPAAHDGTATDENGSRIWSGSLTDPIGTAPTFFASVFENTANGAGAGMEIDYAPTLTVGSAGSTYTESTNLPGSPAGPTVDVATSPVVNDADQAIIQGATVAISTGFVTGDQLTFTNSGGITGSYNATTGVVTFTGNASFAAYQTVLDSVRFTNAGDNPTDYGASTSRIISFTVFDGLINSDPATATVTVVGINDAPVNTIQGAALGISEDALNVVLSTTGDAISVNDVDANPATQDIRVTLSVTQGTLTILTNVTGGIIAGDITGGANGTATITITATQNQINATLAALNGLLYNPIADYNGSDTLTIVTNDLGLNGTDPLLTGTLTSEQDSDSRTINIAAVVDIANDPVTVGEDSGTTTINVLGNDSFENAGRFISLVTQGLHGTVTIVDGPTTPGIMDYVTYTPIADYYGSDSFTYTVTSGGVTETATVNVTVTAVVDIADDPVTVDEDSGATTINVLGNDSFENADRVITVVTQGLHGAVVIVDGPTTPGVMDYVTYTPVADYYGLDSFTYTVTSGGVTETATVNVTVTAVADIMNDLVIVDEDSGTTSLNGIGNVSLIANDSFENAGRAITSVTQGVNGGVVAIHNNGTMLDATDDYVTYAPALNYNGPDSFTYTVTSGGVTETATVNVTVNARNDAPVNTVGAAVIISEDATNVPLTGMSIADVDVDPANDPITVVLAVVHGALTISETVLNGLTAANITDNGTGSVTIIATLNQINATFANATGVLYTPTANYNGSDTLTLTTNDGGYTGADGALEDADDRAITVNAVNDTPLVTLAATGSSTEQVAGAVDAMATIADIDLDALNGGNGNYANATLTIANNGGPDANDLFAIGTSVAFAVNGGTIEAPGGAVFATFVGGNGTPLIITFTSSGTAATTALVNAVVQAIQYTYTGDVPPVAGIDVAISLNDGAPGNAGQGSIAGHPAVGSDIIHLSIINTPENANPVISDLNGDIATFTEGDVAGVLLDDSSLPELAATVADADNPASFNGGSLTVAITANENAAQDLLGISTGGTVTLSDGTNIGSVVSVGGLAVGTVTANGTGGNDLVIAFDTTDATPANISTLIGALTYFNSGGLDPSTAARTVSVTVTDGLGGSGSANVTVNVVGINQEPTLTATGADPTLIEGGPPADLFGAVTAATNETGQTFASMTLNVTNVTDGASEFLSFDGSTVALTDGNSVLTLTNGLTVNVSLAGTTATVTFSGAALSNAALQILVDGLAYGNSSDNPTDDNRVVTITEIVDSGSNVAPNDNVATLAIASSVNVDPVNDNPVNNVPGTQTIDEDGSLTLSAANLNAISVADPDATLLTVTLSVTNGTLTLASVIGLDFAPGGGDGTDDVSMTFSGTAADINTALGDGLTYTPNTDYNGSDSIVIATTDNGESGSGGTQTDNDSVTVNVTPINDQPNIPNSPTVTTDEQVAVTLNAAITVSDVDLDARNGGAGDYSGAAFAINRSVSDAEDVFSFNTVGAQFTVNGSNLESGGNVIATLAQSGGILNINFVNNGTVPTTALVNDVLQHLQYTNTSEEPPASVNLLYILDDGAPGGGQGALGAPFNNLDGGQVTVNINSVNDAPSGTSATIVINEDSARVLAAADFGFSDTAEGDAFAGIVLTTLPTAGILVFDSDGPGGLPGVLAFQGQFVTAAQLTLGALTYFPGLHGNGDDYSTFTFQVRDAGGTANGGQNTDQSANTITFDVTSVNDAPSGTNNTVTGSEDDPYVFTLADFGYGDPADLDDFAGVIFTTVPTTGTLFYDADGPGMGAPVALADGAGPIAAADIAAGRVYFVPVPDAFASPYASFTFQVQDDGGMTNGGQNTDQSPNTMVINIAPDNLPPVVDLDGGTAGVNYTASYTEDAPGIAIGSGVLVSDPDSGLGDMIESATITLTDRVAGDSLTLTGALPPGILAVTTPSAGAITIQITGPGTGAQYQALIQSIQYATTSQDPTVGGTDLSRTVTVTVNDGTINSATATTIVNITALDDAPVAQPDAYTITESGTIVGGNLFADNGSGTDSDPDGPPLAISAVGGGPGANVGTPFTLDSGATLTVNANGTFDYNPGSIFLPTPTGGSGASNTPSHDSFTYTLAGGNTVTVSITLTGLDTNDTLLGTAGTDILAGGNGNDSYRVENASDVVLESVGGGFDGIYVAMALASYTLAAGSEVEILSAILPGSATAMDLTGNEYGNTIIGSAGVNTLIGGGGADVLAGGLGNDFYRVEDAGDVILEYDGGGFDSVYVAMALGSYTLQAGYEIELLSAILPGSTAALDLTGNEYGNTIIGSAGVNTLIGGGGNDVLAGGLGNDAYRVEDAGDVILEYAGGGFDSVYVAMALGSYTLNAGAEVELLSAILPGSTAALDLTGNEYANTIIGSAGVNTLIGGGGADVLAGGLGNDLYRVEDAGDVILEYDGGGFDSVYVAMALGSYTLQAGYEIELLSAILPGSTAALDLTGNEYGNTIIGSAGVNTLIGGGGADVLAGGLGNDFYRVEDAGDVILESAGGGFDSVYVALALGSYTLNAGAEVELLSAIEPSSTAAFDLTGNEYGQTIIGTAGVNTLIGGGGNDVMAGGLGNDFYRIEDAGDFILEYAGGGFDAAYVGLALGSYTLNAGAEVEILSAIEPTSGAAFNLTGNEYGQTIIGTAGANIITGGGGADDLYGLAGNDTYYVDVTSTQVFENAGGGNDAVYTSTSFTLGAGQEIEFLSASNFSATSPINLTGNELANTIYGNDGDNILDGKGGNDALVGGGGADTYAFTTALGGSTVDLVFGFELNIDRIALDDAIFGAGIGSAGAFNANAFHVGAAAHDLDDRIIYNNATGQLFFDADGSGAGAAVQFATLSPGLSLTASDFQVI